MRFRERMHIATVKVNQYLEYAPFTIDLPVDVEEITGIFVGTNARVYARGSRTLGNPATVSVISPTLPEKFLPPYPSKLKLKNQASGYFLTKEIPVTTGGGGTYRLGLKIKPFLIGKCTFKTNFDGAGIFHVQDIYPSQAVFRFANGIELLSESLSYGKPGVPFSTVSIGGKAGEISGFLDWDKGQDWSVLAKNQSLNFLPISNDASDTSKYLSQEGITLTIYLRYRY